jgi:hypothetical protein
MDSPFFFRRLDRLEHLQQCQIVYDLERAAYYQQQAEARYRKHITRERWTQDRSKIAQHIDESGGGRTLAGDTTAITSGARTGMSINDSAAHEPKRHREFECWHERHQHAHCAGGWGCEYHRIAKAKVVGAATCENAISNPLQKKSHRQP